MPVIGILLLIVAAAFALIVVATIMVIIGVHQEEAAKTVVRGLRPQTISALLARRVLNAHLYLIPGQMPGTEAPGEEEPPWYESPRPPRAS
jgi:hypothetical protein